NLSEDQEKAIRETLIRALKAGHARLIDGAAAMDAVEAAIVVLEDSPLFNAGRGAVFNSQGSNLSVPGSNKRLETSCRRPNFVLAR
ncbi:MAG: isoaspartyl peptidase/L-asparaginase, partial [Gammaproteobacteria bacterium]